MEKVESKLTLIRSRIQQTTLYITFKNRCGHDRQIRDIKNDEKTGHLMSKAGFRHVAIFVGFVVVQNLGIRPTKVFGVSVL